MDAQILPMLNWSLDVVVQLSEDLLPILNHVVGM